MKRFCVVLLLPFLLANACETRRLAPRPDWEANDVDQVRLGRLAADPWLKPTELSVGDAVRNSKTGKQTGWVIRGNTFRETEVPEAADLEQLALDEVHAAMMSGWTLLTARCQVFNPRGAWVTDASSPRDSYWQPKPGSSEELERFDACAVLFAKSMDDFDHEQFATLCYTYHALPYCPIGADYKDGDSTPVHKIIRVRGMVPHHADQGWPKFYPTPLEQTCLTDRFATIDYYRAYDEFPMWDGSWLGPSGALHFDTPHPGERYNPPDSNRYPYNYSPYIDRSYGEKTMRGKVCPLTRDP